MKEIDFINTNIEKWKTFERIILGKKKDRSLDEMISFYREVLEDLSYCKTYFPTSKIVPYLNKLSLETHHKIYKFSGDRKQQILSFFSNEYPLLVKKNKSKFLIAITLFSLGVFIGVLSASYDDTFLRVILGEQYLKMTLENIENNDPLAVYKSMAAFDMFLAITVNNIRVAFTAFALGCLFSIGTGILIVYNGIMLGAFHHIFYRHGLLGESILTVWLHGSLEIPAILIAGAAGMVIGNSFLFPGTYSRIKSFQKGALSGGKIVLGVVPVFVIAGFIEGFVTRYTEMPSLLKLLIITANFIFIAMYFVVLPIIIDKSGEE